MIKVAMACDHIVTDVKDQLKLFLESKGYEVIDCGTFDNNRTHYPIYGHKAASLVAEKKADFAAIMCGTGVGISNAANKTKGIRAVLVRDISSAIQAREEFDANVIAVGGRVSGAGLIEEIYETFLKTKYIKDKTKEDRNKKINDLIKNKNYQSDIFTTQCQRWDKGYYHD